MKLVGFNFNKISIEKFSNKSEKINAKMNIEIKEILKIKENVIKSKEDLLAIEFVYNIDYSPEFAKIEFTGTLLLSIDPKEAKEILKEWEKKKTPKEFRMAVYNIILKKANVKALSLEDEIGLPLHIQLPFFKKEEEV
ncbi:hypothetical protein CMI44_01535 [Candidatus Pacearchaeota archaeon]|nr:hypothetical protein [Candidatus Pacearchaeota archaeon]